MKIFLANDTRGQGHSGSEQVMRSVLYQLRAHDVTTHPCGSLAGLERIRDCDAVVINAEGTWHHGSDGGWVIANVARTAHMLGKPCHVINATYQEYSDAYRATLAGLDSMQVRESRSLEFAQAHGMHRARVRMDSVFDLSWGEYPRQPTRKGIIAGGIDSASRFARVLDELPGFSRFSCFNLGWDDLVKVVSGADLYVTGQWHGICAALLAETPFVAIPSNSHKIEAFLDDLGIPGLPVLRSAHRWESALDIVDAVDWPAVWDNLTNLILTRPPFRASDVFFSPG